MFHKSQTAIKNYSKTLNYNRISLNLASKRLKKSSKSPTNTRKKINTRIQSSFTICDEIYSPYSRLRSTSVDRKHKTISLDYSGLKKSSHPLSSFQKFDEKVFQFITQGRQDIQKGKINEALVSFSKALEIDSKSLEALYNKGLANMLLNLYKEASIDFLNLLRENILYNKDVYLKLGMCFQSMNDTSTAIRYLSQGLYRFPKYYEGFLYRGQLYNSQKQYEKALSDFKKVLNSSKNEGSALIGIAESLEGVGDIDTAIKTLEQAKSCPETLNLALLKSGILKGKINDPTALNDLDLYIEKNPNCSQAYYCKGEIFYSNHSYLEAGLSFEQCIRCDNNNEYSPKAIFHLGAIKIHEKDFYGAIHTFERVGKFELKDQKVLKSYAEAVINLMKRKYKDGIAVFNKLLKKQDPVMKEYIGTCYMYRGYGYNALNLHEKAIRSFKKATIYGKLNKASLYNQELSYALLAASKNNYQVFLTYIEKCLKIFPKKPEPYIYNSAMVLSLSISSKNVKKMEEAYELLQKAVNIREADSEVLFFRSTILYLLNNHNEAINDIKLSIEKAEDNIPEHYVLRGLLFAFEKNYSDAVQDFTIALQLKESLDYVF